jgi:hypothetical protein
MANRAGIAANPKPSRFGSVPVHDGETVMTKQEGWYKSAMPSQKTDGGD